MASTASSGLSSSRLYGACACERNQYTIHLPSEHMHLARVFFDNSAANRRPLASPLTAWLRIPLSWYHSTTYGIFPDETHASIKRSFYSHSANPAIPPTRRQFCGYCGTHLTAWNEVALSTRIPASTPAGSLNSAEYLDVTLGSLLGESLDRLEDLQILDDADEGGDARSEIRDDAASTDYAAQGGLVRDDRAGVNTESHRISGDDVVMTSSPTDGPRRIGRPSLHMLNGRGVPYFEEMVENSRYGRIKRQKGAHVSDDGTSVVQWEVIEMDGDGPEAGPEAVTEASSSLAGTKRTRKDS